MKTLLELKKEQFKLAIRLGTNHPAYKQITKMIDSLMEREILREYEREISNTQKSR